LGQLISLNFLRSCFH